MRGRTRIRQPRECAPRHRNLSSRARACGREQSPLDWAATKHHLGGALVLLGERDKDSGPLREAVEAYLGAIEEWTRDRAPLDWAKAQHNLGNALQLLGEQECDPERLRQAAEAYRARSRNAPAKPRHLNGAGRTTVLATHLLFWGLREARANAFWRPSMPIERLSTALTGSTRRSIGRSPKTILARRLRLSARVRPAPGLLHQAVAAYRAALEEAGPRPCAL